MAKKEAVSERPLRVPAKAKKQVGKPGLTVEKEGKATKVADPEERENSTEYQDQLYSRSS